MHDVEPGLWRRVRAAASSRRPIFTWKTLLPLAALALILWFVLADRSDGAATPLSYTQLINAIDAGRVAAIDVEPGYGVRGRWTVSQSRDTDFFVQYTVGDMTPLLTRAEQARVAITFRRAGASDAYKEWVALGGQGLVVLALLLLVYWGFRHQMGGRAQVGATAHRNSTTFADVAGTEGAAEELREIVEFLSAPAAFSALGAQVPKGVLLIGPPGTGKTLLARAIAGEAGVPFFFLSGSEVTGFIVGLGAQRIRSLFKKARSKGGVIFVDEVDALGGMRGRNRSHNEDDRTLNQLLVEMDGFSQAHGVVVIGATNRPEDLDVALKRPGRFDRIVSVGLPNAEGREAILKLHAIRKRVPLATDVDLHRLARLLPGWSGAELANLLNEAAIAAVRERANQVAWSHFETARDRMLLGKERVGFRAADREWQTVAYHEAGHALAGVVACPEDGLHKVTIQPRGQAMGVAHFAPEDDRHLYSRRYLEAQIVKGLGGRVAEEIIFGAEDVTGGAESDLVHVNRIARRMIYRLGMGEETRLLVYDEQAPLSGEAQARMDAEVEALLQRLYDRTTEIMVNHKPALDALAHALLERETLEGNEAVEILRQSGVDVRVGAELTAYAEQAVLRPRG